MTVKTRTMLFYVLFFLFIVFGSTLTAYSLGIKLDFRTLSLNRTGGIYLKSEPPDVYIFLNSLEVENQTGLLQSGTLIDNLVENFYHVTITKDGYFDWEKEVEVERSKVEVFDSIVLVPKTDPEWLTNPVSNFQLNGSDLVLEKNGKVVAGEINFLGSKIGDFVEEGSLITYDEKTKIYYLSNLFKPGSALNVNALFNNLKESRLGLTGAVPIVRVVFHPFNHKKLIIQSRGALYNLDTTRLNLEQIRENVKDFRVKGEEVVFYDTQAIYRYNLIFRTETKVLELDKEDTAVKDIRIDAVGRIIALFEDGRLLLVGASEVLNIADKARMVTPSGDSKFIAFVDYDGPIYMYRVDKKNYLKLDTGIAEEVTDIAWYKDNRHLFIRAENELYFTEVDDDLPLNTIRLATDVSAFEYQSNTNFLYFSTPDGIYRYKMEL